MSTGVGGPDLNFVAVFNRFLTRNTRKPEFKLLLLRSGQYRVFKDGMYYDSGFADPGEPVEVPVAGIDIEYEAGSCDEDYAEIITNAENE